MTGNPTFLKFAVHNNHHFISGIMTKSSCYKPTDLPNLKIISEISKDLVKSYI